MCNTKRFSGVFGLKVGLGLFNPCELWDARAAKAKKSRLLGPRYGIIMEYEWGRLIS